MPFPPPISLSEDFEEFSQRQAAAPPFPFPGPAAEEPSESDPAYDMPELAYFEPIGPIDEIIIWRNRAVPVQLRLLDIFEERELTRQVDNIPGAEKLIVERQLRLALSIVSVDGNVVHFDDDPVKEQIEREDWVSRFAGSLLMELSKAYERAAAQPVIELGKLQADPK